MENILQQLENSKKDLQNRIEHAAHPDDIEAIRIAILGRKGIVTDLMAQLKTLSLEEKRIYGPLINDFKRYAEETIEHKLQQILALSAQKELQLKKDFDVTAYRFEELKGTLHIYSHIIEQLQNIFISMGYEIADGPEAEIDYYNFETLNIPPDHPARELEDTLWLTLPHMLLRTQTSPIQTRIMQKKQPPLAIFAPGRVYRKEATDQTHDFLFTQGEIMFIDKNISVGHLLATAKTFLQAFFEKKDLNIRIRPGYFPFVEPGLEIDASCPFCTSGCSTCKKTGWIELLGSGLIHPNVLKAGGIDPAIYSGFAMGFGIERIAMVKYGINDIRLFHSSKIDFLDQFS